MRFQFFQGFGRESSVRWESCSLQDIAGIQTCNFLQFQVHKREQRRLLPFLLETRYKTKLRISWSGCERALAWRAGLHIEDAWKHAKCIKHQKRHHKIDRSIKKYSIHFFFSKWSQFQQKSTFGMETTLPFAEWRVVQGEHRLHKEHALSASNWTLPWALAVDAWTNLRICLWCRWWSRSHAACGIGKVKQMEQKWIAAYTRVTYCNKLSKLKHIW